MRIASGTGSPPVQSEQYINMIKPIATPGLQITENLHTNKDSFSTVSNRNDLNPGISCESGIPQERGEAVNVNA